MSAHTCQTNYQQEPTFNPVLAIYLCLFPIYIIHPLTLSIQLAEKVFLLKSFYFHFHTFITTVASYYDIFRDLVAASLDDEDCQIGGEGVIVEIDEIKMGKRKYNRGHRVEGVWV